MAATTILLAISGVAHLVTFIGGGVVISRKNKEINMWKENSRKWEEKATKLESDLERMKTTAERLEKESDAWNQRTNKYSKFVDQIVSELEEKKDYESANKILKAHMNGTLVLK